MERKFWLQPESPRLEIKESWPGLELCLQESGQSFQVQFVKQPSPAGNRREEAHEAHEAHVEPTGLKQGWDSAYASSLLRFLDWMLQLPEDLEELYDHEAKSILEEDSMPYVTSWKLRAIAVPRKLSLCRRASRG